jgi:hypothetical protein
MKVKKGEPPATFFVSTGEHRHYDEISGRLMLLLTQQLYSEQGVQGSVQSEKRQRALTDMCKKRTRLNF